MRNLICRSSGTPAAPPRGRTASNTRIEHLPQVADAYERGLSLNVMSKAYRLPRLRIGWIATADATSSTEWSG